MADKLSRRDFMKKAGLTIAGGEPRGDRRARRRQSASFEIDCSILAGGIIAPLRPFPIPSSS